MRHLCPAGKLSGAHLTKAIWNVGSQLPPSFHMLSSRKWTQHIHVTSSSHPPERAADVSAWTADRPPARNQSRTFPSFSFLQVVVPQRVTALWRLRSRLHGARSCTLCCDKRLKLIDCFFGQDLHCGSPVRTSYLPLIAAVKGPFF